MAPELLTSRTLGTWQAAGANRERLVDRTGKVHAEVFRLRISGRWAWSKGGLLSVVGSREEAKARAEGAGE